MNNFPAGGAGSGPPSRPQSGHPVDSASTSVPPPDDGAPPVLGPLSVKLGNCVQVELAVNKLAEVTVVFIHGEQVLPIPARRRSDGLMVVTSLLSPLPPQQMAQVWAEAVDAQGRASMAPPQGFTTPHARPTVLISEVLANPAGSEYTQEYVELYNFGPEPIVTAGWTIEDANAADALPNETLAAGARALLVAEEFDPAAGLDPSPAADTLLLRLPARIGKDGLTNMGENIILRGSDGQIISQYGPAVNVSAPTWNGRSVHRVPQNDPCDDKLLWTDRPQPPTRGW